VRRCVTTWVSMRKYGGEERYGCLAEIMAERAVEIVDSRTVDLVFHWVVVTVGMVVVAGGSC